MVVITKRKIQNFFWKDIVYRFGILRTIIFDSGQQFGSQNSRKFCGELGIKNHYSSPGHPQENG